MAYPSLKKFVLPNQSIFRNGDISSYDQIIIGDQVMLLEESPTGGIELVYDEQQASGNDYSRIVGKGYKGIPVSFKLLLMYDMARNIDYMELYDQKVRDILMPKGINKKNAIAIYNPLLEAEGCNSIVITKRPAPVSKGKQMFTVSIDALDIRKIRIGAGTKTFKQDTKLISKGTVLGKDSPPSEAKKGKP